MKKNNEEVVINIASRIKPIIIGIKILVKVVNKEIEKIDLPNSSKKLCKWCFVYGLSSAIIVELKKIVEEYDKSI